MKTRISDAAEMIEATDRGSLPYAGGDHEEIAVCESAMKELDRVIAAAKALRKTLKESADERRECLSYAAGWRK